jgi:hypothetical protein
MACPNLSLVEQEVYVAAAVGEQIPFSLVMASAQAWMES